MWVSHLPFCPSLLPFFPPSLPPRGITEYTSCLLWVSTLPDPGEACPTHFSGLCSRVVSSWNLGAPRLAEILLCLGTLQSLGIYTGTFSTTLSLRGRCHALPTHQLQDRAQCLAHRWCPVLTGKKKRMNGWGMKLEDKMAMKADMHQRSTGHFSIDMEWKTTLGVETDTRVCKE